MRKEELRHDPVREYIVRGVAYIKDHQSTVIKAFGAFVLLVAALSYYSNIGAEQTQSASNIAGMAQNSFINGSQDEAMVKFERVLDDYPSTQGAVQSLVYMLKDKISNADFEGVSALLYNNQEAIDSIEDPVVQAYIYKVQGDIAMKDGNYSTALSSYRNAQKVSKGTALEVKYQLDAVTVLISQLDYNKARSILEEILEIDDVGYNEKNKAEEMLAFVNQKLGT